MTVEVNGTMTVRKTIAVAQVIPQYRHTEGKGRRRLLTADEVLRLPNDELLIVMRGQKVLKAKKFDYTEYPMAKHIERKPIFEYVPQRQAAGTSFSQTEPDDYRQPSEPTVRPASGSSLYGAAKPPDEF